MRALLGHYFSYGRVRANLDEEAGPVSEMSTTDRD